MGPVLALLAIGIPLILLSIKLACDNRTEQKKIKGMSDDDIVERIKSENEFERDYIEKLKKEAKERKLKPLEEFGVEPDSGTDDLKEIKEIARQQLDTLRTIKNICLFFLILTIIGIVFSVIGVSNILAQIGSAF